MKGWQWLSRNWRSVLGTQYSVLGTSTAEFLPLPLLGNPHVQTLLGNYWRGPLRTFPVREHPVWLPDGDGLMLHDSVPAGGSWQPGQRMALLVHGLGGSHLSGYMQRMTGLLLANGLRAVRLDLRGCGRGAALARGPYNAGCSGDVRAALAELHRWAPTSPLVLIGFSLGGNIVLKLAGEMATHPVPGLDRVVAVAPPIDLERCSDLISAPRNRLYDRFFVRTLLRQVRRQQRYFPELPRVRLPRDTTLRLFDELYTAPRSGYANALDYYGRAASQSLLPHIPVPTFILTARDDPFIAVEPFKSLTVPSHVEIHIAPRGGHLGFLGWDGAGGIRWAECRIAEWVTRK